MTAPQITDKHKAFVRAIVEVAREHGANHLNMSFDFASSKAFRDRDDHRYQSMRMEWSEGRHGSRAPITINASEQVRLSESIET